MLLKENNEANRVVNVIDCPMGAGKTSAMIEYMNAMPDNEKVIYCTPYIDEGKRVEECCWKKGITNIAKNKYDNRKITDLRERIRQGQNVACTHALLEYFDDDILESIRNQNYTLVIDEAYDVLRTFTERERKILDFFINNNHVVIDPKTKCVSFINQEEIENCEHVSEHLTSLINRGDVCFIKKAKVTVWTFPIKVLNAFQRVAVMTYMFEAQTIYYYLLSNGYQIAKFGVRENNGGNFELCLTEQADGFRYNVAEKIHIYDGEKLNSIGAPKNSLSSTWYKRNRNNIGKTGVKQLANNYVNLLKHVFKCSNKDFIWTCFGGGDEDKHKDNIKNLIIDWQKDLAKNFVSSTKRACNEFSDRHYLAYGLNWTTHPDSYNYFKSLGYTMDKSAWELSVMLQWIWRSAIRNGEEIYIYIPSLKMRNLLIEWIEKTSKGGNADEK